MVSRVDSPPPEVARIATNSRSAALRSMFSSASTRRSPLTHSFETPAISIMRGSRSCVRLERAPAQQQAPGPDADPAGEEAAQPHREHGRHADVQAARSEEHTSELQSLSQSRSRLLIQKN